MKIQGTASTLLYVIGGILLAFGIHLGLGVVLATNLPIVAVESNSMVPTFSKGDLLVLQGVPYDTLKVGDIIVFTPFASTTPVVHRIIIINPDGTLQTKGDANPTQHPFETRIEPKQIHGKVITIVPFLGLVKIATTEYIIPNLYWSAPLAIVILAIYYLKKSQRKRR